MISQLKNNRSLTFYQPTTIQNGSHLSTVHAGGLGAVAISSAVSFASTTTTQFNTQLGQILNRLNAERDRIAQKVADGLANDPSYTAARNDGVNLAWEYEKADVEMGGKGSSNWNKNQRQQIKENGRVKGAEGHHQKNVATHPEEQGNPDNIKFYKNKQEHLKKGHDGNFQNETDSPLIDKNKMLKRTNTKRVFKNELRGVGIAAAIGAGIGFTIGFAISLAQSGVSPDSMKYALCNGGKTAVSAGAQSVVGYGIGRTIGQVATRVLEHGLAHIGIGITENISKMCSMGTVGTITIVVFSAIEFIKLKRDGMASRDAIIKVGKQTLFSLSLLAVSIVAQGIWGGAAGLVVSISTGIIFVTYSLADTVHQRKISEEIRIYMIDKCKPFFTSEGL